MMPYIFPIRWLATPNSARAMPDLPPFVVRSLLGLVLGIVLGFAARRGQFCTLGAIEDVVYGNDTRRLRAWFLATADCRQPVNRRQRGGFTCGCRTIRCCQQPTHQFLFAQLQEGHIDLTVGAAQKTSICRPMRAAAVCDSAAVELVCGALGPRAGHNMSLPVQARLGARAVLDQLRSHKGYAREDAPRSIDALDETERDSISPIGEHNRNARGCSLGCARRRCAASYKNYRHSTGDRVSRNSGNLSSSLFAQRKSMATLWPST